MSFKNILLTGTVMLVACGADPQPAAASTPVRTPPLSGEYGVLDDALRGYADKGLFSGVVRIERDHRPAFEQAYGLASVELGVPSAPGHRYKLHSATKPILAVAVMRTVQDERLQLDGSICEYLSPCPDAWAPVTVRHLLNHTSGIPDFTEDLVDHWRGSIGATLAQMQTRLPALKPVFQPGEKWSYSNAGYALLSRVLELEYERPIDQILHILVFEPAGMKDTTLERAPRYESNDPRYEGPMYDGQLVEAGEASGYNGSPEALQSAYSKMYVIPGAGGVVTTAADMGRFVEALFEGKLIGAEARKTMLTVPDPQTEVAGRPGIPKRKADQLALTYALGWKIEDKSGRRAYGHSGGNNGFIAYFAYYPDSRQTVVILSNRGFTPLGEILGDVRSALFEDAPAGRASG